MKGKHILEWLALAGLILGLLTIVAGGRALFGSPEARAAVGQAVPFVLWFNFLAGFVYVVAGAGLRSGAARGPRTSPSSSRSQRCSSSAPSACIPWAGTLSSRAQWAR